MAFLAAELMDNKYNKVLHKTVFRLVFTKTKKENGNHSLNQITDINTDFEQEIFKSLASELNAQKQLQKKSVKHARTNLCSGHYSSNLSNKLNSSGGKNYYSHIHPDFDEKFKRCIRKLRALFVMPPEKIEIQALKIKKKAQRLFNGGKNGRGKRGSKMAIFSDVYDLSEKYRNGKNCTAAQLSTYHRMQNRSNQPNEGGNKFRNFVGKEVVRQGAKPTIESWAKQQQLLENEASGRWMEIYKEGRDYKKKNKKCAKLDDLLTLC